MTLLLPRPLAWKQVDTDRWYVETAVGNFTIFKRPGAAGLWGTKHGIGGYLDDQPSLKAAKASIQRQHDAKLAEWCEVVEATPALAAAEAFANNEDAAGPNYCEARDGSLSISSFTINVDLLAQAFAAHAAAAVQAAELGDHARIVRGIRREEVADNIHPDVAQRLIDMVECKPDPNLTVLDQLDAPSPDARSE